MDHKSLFPSEVRQEARLKERRNSARYDAHVCGLEFQVFPGVYHTSVDTELMVDCVEISKAKTFLEIGCGCGAVSVLLAKRGKSGLGVDINALAVENAIANAQMHGITNVGFSVSDVFSAVTGKFDVLVCNPPYNRRLASDPVERMFWDPDDEMKRSFFAGAKSRLKKRGVVYFGWANFKELDESLPFQLARSCGFRYVSHCVQPAPKSDQLFLVLKFKPVW